MLVAVLFCLGNIDAALNTPTEYPYIQIFAQAVGTNSGATGMVRFCRDYLGFAMCSERVQDRHNHSSHDLRDNWVSGNVLANVVGIRTRESNTMPSMGIKGGFDRATTGSPWREEARLTDAVQIHQKTALPLVSITVCVVINVLFAFINIGSTAAFNAFTSLTVAAFYSSFIIAASVMLYRRLTRSTSSLRWGPFRMGRSGTPVLIFSIAYSLVAWLFSFWPQNSAVTPQNMNWSVVVYAGVLVFALVYWFVTARHVYTGPIVEVSLQDVVLEERTELRKNSE